MARTPLKTLMAVAPYDRWARDYDRRWRQYTAETLTALQLPVKVYHRAVRVGLMVGSAARPTQWEGCAFWRDIMGLDMTYGDDCPHRSMARRSIDESANGYDDTG